LGSTAAVTLRPSRKPFQVFPDHLSRYPARLTELGFRSITKLTYMQPSMAPLTERSVICKLTNSFPLVLADSKRGTGFASSAELLLQSISDFVQMRELIRWIVHRRLKALEQRPREKVVSVLCREMSELVRLNPLRPRVSLYFTGSINKYGIASEARPDLDVGH